MAAVVANPKVSVSGPYPMSSHQRIPNSPVSQPSAASRSKMPSSSSNISSTSTSTPSAKEGTSRPAFVRIRSSLEQSLRSAARSKKVSAPTEDYFSTASKGKEKVRDVDGEKEKGGMFRRLESKVGFRRGGRESVTPSPSPMPPSPTPYSKREDGRLAGFTSFITPSLRQASMSSPALHLSSQALPSPKSKSAVPVSSSSGSDALVSPPRERSRRISIQSPLKDASSMAVKPPTTPTRTQYSSKHRATKSQPLNIPTSASAANLLTTSHPSPLSNNDRDRGGDFPSPPSTPTPASSSRNQLTHTTSKTQSSTHLPISTPSQIKPRGTSPIRPRSPSRTRVVTPTNRGLTSSSTSHLPISSGSPSARRTSMDGQRRPSIDSPRRPSIDGSRKVSDHLRGSRDESPSPIRPRPTSPTSRSYAQNRHFNISSGSLIAPSNSEHRELIRSATSMLCKEIKKPPHLSRVVLEEVEHRIQNLARLERIWDRGFSGSSNGLSSGGEERERRLFVEALKDGYVLCQLMNKLRSSSIVKPDPKEDGFIRTANVTKFLAACSSYGLSNDDLFHRDDLIDGNSESLARVAKTIIALIKFVDTPDQSRFVSGRARKQSSSTSSGPYSQGPASRSASSSSPNLLSQRTISPQPSSPSRKRFSPSGLPSVRSDSPDEFPSKVRGGDVTPNAIIQEHHHVGDNDREIQDGQRIMPPPRSPLRTRPHRTSNEENGHGLFTRPLNSERRVSLTDSTRASFGDASIRESLNDSHTVRQSVASAATETSTTTMLSSLLEVGRSTSSVFNRFGTTRTTTTEATSEAPSISRTEEVSIPDDSSRKRDMYKMNDSVVDLSRVEEVDESGSSSRGKMQDSEASKRKIHDIEIVQEKVEKGQPSPAIHLGKGRWPDDFMDAMQSHNQRSKEHSPDPDDHSHSSTPLSISPPKKLAIVGANRRNESSESVSHLPRRPTNRARHSVDPVLIPKESLFRRDNSPDVPPSPSSRVVPRRHSSKPGALQRSATTLLPKEDLRGSENDSLVPFPRATSGEHSPSRPSSSDDRSESDRPRLPRGRFQSDVGGTKRRPRPSSYDELGARPIRSRFESMVNLGVASSTASASDLMSRDSMDGSAVRKTITIKEEGKPPTHFQLGNCIGRGQFGSVYRALNLNTGQMVAVKRIRLDGLKEEEVTQLMREVDLVKSLSHPTIVKYEGMARDEDTLSIVLEYAENGSLGQTLKAFGKLNERLVASYVVKILEGLHYLHQSDVVHCDLKAANILTTKNGNVKLSDFGVSLNMRAVERDIKDVAGTPNWMAPEVIELKGASPKSDIWSLACTVIELLTGKPPYADIANSMSVMFRIVEDDMPPLPEDCSKLLKDFLTSCFNKDPKDRPTAEELCEHQWLKANWGALKELRPQDSIPFLRRVSADIQKSDAIRMLAAMDIPDSPATEQTPRADEFMSGSPPGRRMSNSSQPRPPPILTESEISPREHNFVKTTFSKPMLCRVCLLHVKKSAVLCAQCSLISHSKCAVNAPPTCDLRAQLLLYAQYAEKGNPGSIYSNPIDLVNDSFPKSPVSDVSYVAHTPRTSIDLPLGPPQSPIPPPSSPPPTAFKFMAALKKSRTGAMSPEPGSSTTSLTQESSKPKVLRKNAKDRPQSIASSSTHGPSSVRSGTTAPESAGRKSMISGNGADLSSVGESGGLRPPKISSVSGHSDIDDERHSTHWHIPGDLAAAESRRHKKNKSSNCLIQ